MEKRISSLLFWIATGLLAPTAAAPRTPLEVLLPTQGSLSFAALERGRSVPLSRSLLVEDPSAAEPVRQVAEASLAIAQADLDEDGVPDLITAYATRQGGLLVLHRGDVDALFPSPVKGPGPSPGESAASPFFPGRLLILVDLAPVFLAAGDWDSDGHLDVAISDGQQPKMLFLKGDGQGHVEIAREVSLDGPVSAMIAAEVNRRDGLTDLVLGVRSPDGSQLLVFQSKRGALLAEPEVHRLDAEITSLAVGRFRGDWNLDVAAGMGDTLLLLTGQDRDFNRREVDSDPGSRLEFHPLGYEIRDLASGDFLGLNQTDLALRAADGRFFVIPDVEMIGEGMDVRQRAREISSPGSLALEISTANPAGRPPRLARVRVSGAQKDDLLLLEPGGSRLHFLVGAMPSDGDPDNEEIAAWKNADLPSPAAMLLSMRLNGDALEDLVLLRDPQAPLLYSLSQPQAVFSVNSTADTEDDMPGDGSCDDGSGNCTLPAAIEEANATAAVDLIVFNIPGSGIPLIQVSNLPQFTRPVTIDGTSQSAGMVEIRGDKLDFQGGNSSARGLITDSIGLTLAGTNFIEGNDLGSATSFNPAVAAFLSNNNVIGGTVPQARNVVSGSLGQGIWITQGSGNRIQGNYIGTDSTGSSARANQLGGVWLFAASGNTIGGTEAGAGNVISGNRAEGFAASPVGIQISLAFQGETPVPANDNLVQGNLIGLAADGQSALPNGIGIQVLGDAVSENMIGGPSPAARNVISGNLAVELSFPPPGQLAFPAKPEPAGPGTVLFGGWGISIGGGPDATVVLGNYVGTDLSGTSSVPNSQHGIIVTGSSNNLIENNVISFNGLDGVLIAESQPVGSPIVPATGNQITANSIFSNGGLGINLLGGQENSDGATANDEASFLNPPDFDTGANQLQNYPVLELDAEAKQLTGTLMSTPNTQFRIEFFENPSCDPSEFGEGKTFLGALDFDPQMRTDGMGILEFTAPFEASPDQLITATATDLDGNTSEFSSCAAPSGIRLSPYLVLGLGLCNSPREIRVEDLASGLDITKDPNVTIDWIKPDGSGLPSSLVEAAYQILRAKDPRIQELIAEIEVNDGQLTFLTEGANVIRATRMLPDGQEQESNYAFVLGGLKLAETGSLEIAPLAVTSLATNTTLADQITEGVGRTICRLEGGGTDCAEQKLDAPMVLFPPVDPGANACGGSLAALGTRGLITVKSLQFDLFGGLIQDQDLMEALADLGLGTQLIGGFASTAPIPGAALLGRGIIWLGKAISFASSAAPFGLTQLLTFEVSSRAPDPGISSMTEDTFISVSNELSTSAPFIKGVVTAKSSGFSAVQATFDIDGETFCPGKATALMPVWVLPDIEKIDIRNEDGRVEEPIVLRTGQMREAESVGLFGFLDGEIRFDPFGLGSELKEMVEGLLPGTTLQLGELGVRRTIRYPDDPPPQDGLYTEGFLFFEADLTFRPFSLGVNSFSIQIPLPNPPAPIPNPNDWAMQPPPVASVNARGRLEGLTPGMTNLDLEACLPFLTRRTDTNPVLVIDNPSIIVQKFEDKQASGSQSNGDEGLNGWEIRLQRIDNGATVTRTTGDIDLNEDGSINPETERGLVIFDNLDPTSYAVFENLRNSWTQTTPNPPVFDLSTSPVGRGHFGNFRHMRIHGRKFEDVNGNGQDDGEPGLPGWTIKLDINSDGIVDRSRLTAADGTYFFNNVGPGEPEGDRTFRVEEVQQEGWVKTFPLTPNEFPMFSKLEAIVDFANFKIMVVGGTKFNDENQNGTRDTGEPGLAGWTIELDLHADGTVDQTATTDSEGRYRLEVGPGDPSLARVFTLRERAQPGWSITQPSAGLYSVNIQSGLNRLNFDFGNAQSSLSEVSGAKLEDLTGDGLSADDTPLPGWEIELLNGAGSVIGQVETDASGRFSFKDLDHGRYTVREKIRDGWIQTFPGIPPTYEIELDEDDPSAVALIFTNFKLGLIAGTKFHDLNQNALRDPGEPVLPGWTFFADSNQNGILDNPGQDGVCTIFSDELCTVSDDQGQFALARLRTGSYLLREILPPNWLQTTDLPESLVVDQSGRSFEILVGNTYLGSLSEIRGVVFQDANENGSRDPGEVGLPGWLVFIDEDSNGILFDEPSTLTSPSGSYVFPALPAGDHRIAVSSRPGWFPTSPVSGLLDVTTSAGEVRSAVDFGFQTDQADLYFPLLKADRTSFAGFAFSNPGPHSFELDLSAMDGAGDLVDSALNPRSLEVPARGQIALQDFEIFGTDPNQTRLSWVRGHAGSSQASSFFQFGGSGNLDGSVAWTSTTNELVFTRLAEGPQAFRGSQALTYLSVANAGFNPVEIDFRYLGDPGFCEVSAEQSPGGALAPKRVTIPALGFLLQSLQELFPELCSSEGFIRVDSVDPDHDSLVGFELVEVDAGHTLLGLNAVVPPQSGLILVEAAESGGDPDSLIIIDLSSRLYSPQLASSPDLFTNLKLVNLGQEEAEVEIRAISETGSELAQPVTYSLAGQSTIHRDIRDLLEFSEPSVVGSLVLETTTPEVVGDVIFGSRNTPSFAAALRLQSDLFTHGVFSQVASLEGVIFTGLAIFNPSQEDARILIEVFDRAGTKTGSRMLTLPAGNRLSALLRQLVPELENQAGGYIVLRSNVGISAQQLFGDFSLTFLSAVPPRIVE